MKLNTKSKKTLSFRLIAAFLVAITSFNLFLQTVLADVGNPGKDGFMPLQAENIEITLDDKLILRDGTPVKEVFNSTDDMVNLLVKVIFIIAGMLIFFMIIMAGLALIKGDSKDKDQAKSQATAAITGFIIMFAAYWIMQLIQVLTGLDIGF